MKKMIKLILAGMMCLSVGACSKPSTESEGNKNNTNMTEVKDAVEVLGNIWAVYKEDEKFAAMGGDFNNTVEDAPGKFDLSEQESLQTVLYLPADGLEMVDDAASLIHMMNANTFTASAFHVKDGNMEKLSSTMKENIMNTQWICGFPDLLVMANVDGYLVTVFGNEEIILDFKAKLLDVYSDAQILYEENLIQ